MKPTKQRPRGGPPKYPWTKWMQPGTNHVLRRPKDFDCSVHSFITYLYIVAKRKGCRVEVAQLADDIVAIKVSNRSRKSA